MRNIHAKLLALVAFNIAVLATAVYLSTYTATRSVQTPFGNFVERIEQPYSLANSDIPSGVVALWLGLGALWVVGSLSVHAVKEPTDRQTRLERAE